MVILRLAWILIISFKEYQFVILAGRAGHSLGAVLGRDARWVQRTIADFRMDLLLQISKVLLAQQTEQSILVTNLCVPPGHIVVTLVLPLLYSILLYSLARKVIEAAAEERGELKALSLVLLVILGRLESQVVLVGCANHQLFGTEVHEVTAT